MRISRLVPASLGIVVAFVVTSQGCGGGGDNHGSGGAGGASSSSGSGESTSGSGGHGGGGVGGGGGAGGSMPAYGPPATDIVSAGEVSQSPGYKLVFTFGQSSTNQEKTTSPSYRLQGGLIGANGSLP